MTSEFCDDLTPQKCPYYTGICTSKADIKLKKSHNKDPMTRSFMLLDEFLTKPQQIDLGLSINTLYNLNDQQYVRHLRVLLEYSLNVLIASSNYNFVDGSKKHRNFVKYVLDKFPNWRLKRVIENPYIDEDNMYLFERQIHVHT
jgi:hypothetical protein